MADKDKTQEQLITELTQLRQRITELEASARRHEKTEEEKAAVLDTISEHVVYQDTRMRILWANRAACESVGVDLQKLIGRHCYEIWPRRRTPCVGCPVAKARKSGHPQEAEIATPDGRVWFIRGYPVRDTKGNITGAIEVTLEITERKQAAEALKESEERLRTAGKIAYDLIYEWDVATDVLQWFGDIDGLLGFRKGEISRNINAWLNLIHPEDRVKLKNAVELHRTSTEPIQYTYRIRHRDGTLRYWIDNGLPLLDDKGHPYKWVGVCTDITDHKQAEEKLRESETRFRTLFESIPDCVIVHDDDGVILHINEIGAQQIEWSATDLIGRNLHEILVPEQKPLIADHIRETHKNGWSRFETTYISRSGWQVEAEVNDRPIKFGEKKAILRVSRDITERKEAERALLKEKILSDAVINSSPGLLFIFGEKGNIIRWNNYVEKVTGYSASEIAEMNIFAFVVKDEQKTATEAVQEALTKGQASVEINLLTKPGKKIPFYIIGRRIKIENVTRVVCTGIDITDRKQAEEKVKRGYKQLRETLVSTVNALASTIEKRDPYTAGHQRRATILACAIAEEMDFPEEEIEGLRMVGLIHDIGKITVPTEILSKPGPLSEMQFDMVKMHPQAGYDILEGIKFPWLVAEIVLQHHERMDGSGYPHGITGEEIMLEARILAVADVVEAMSSHRPYRPALGIDKALEEISQNRVILYDPEVVDTCIRLFTEKGFTFREESET